MDKPPDPDGFLTFLDGDGEAVYLNLGQVKLLAYTVEDERINETTLLSSRGSLWL